MKYLGGKCRLAKEIAGYLNYLRKPQQLYIEPFVGAGWILERIERGPNMACDVHPQLIAMWKALQQGWQPPIVVTRKEYEEARAGLSELHEQAFIGFGCSYGGKWFGGYAQDGYGERNYCNEAKCSLEQKICNIAKDTEFFCCSYIRLNPPSDSLIYCDPPYAGTTKYKDTESFDSDLFWWTMNLWARHSTVVVSEYQAPKGWKCVGLNRVKTSIKHFRPIGKEEECKRTEKLFIRQP